MEKVVATNIVQTLEEITEKEELQTALHQEVATKETVEEVAVTTTGHLEEITRVVVDTADLMIKEAIGVNQIDNPITSSMLEMKEENISKCCFYPF